MQEEELPMATYNVGGNQGTVSSGYKGTVALLGGATLPRRIKLLEYKIGATGNPNSGTDTYIQFDISRLSSTSSIAGTLFLPNPDDSADAASVSAANINQTTEPAAAAIATSLDNYGINQRATVRIVVSQESWSMTSPATTAAGLYARVLSNAYTGACAVQCKFLE
jgi:hypothetical protein